MSENGYDLVVFGATSFVGRLLADYLLRTYGVGQDLTWAIAGRSESRLESLRKELERLRTTFRSSWRMPQTRMPSKQCVTRPVWSSPHSGALRAFR